MRKLVIKCIHSTSPVIIQCTSSATLRVFTNLKDIQKKASCNVIQTIAASEISILLTNLHDNTEPLVLRIHDSQPYFVADFVKEIFRTYLQHALGDQLYSTNRARLEEFIQITTPRIQQKILRMFGHSTPNLSLQ